MRSWKTSVSAILDVWKRQAYSLASHETVYVFVDLNKTSKLFVCVRMCLCSVLGV